MDGHQENNTLEQRILKINEPLQIVFHLGHSSSPTSLKTRIRSINRIERLGVISYKLADNNNLELFLRIKKTLAGVDDYHWSIGEWVLGGKEYAEYTVASLVVDSADDGIPIPVTKEDIKAGVDAVNLVAEFERQLVRTAMTLTSGHQSRAARLLGMSPTTLNSKLKKMETLYGVCITQEQK